MKTYKKGISLIVLVITIIVLSILAATVVISISNANIMSNAEKAVFKSDMANFKDTYDVYIVDKKIENFKFKEESLNLTYASNPDEFINIFGNNVPDKYIGGLEIKKGQLVYNTDNEQELKILGELGMVNVSITLSQTSVNISLEYGKTATYQLTATLNNITGAVSWISSNTELAEVSSSGLVTAKAEGTVYITAKYSSDCSAICEIRITELACTHGTTEIRDASDTYTGDTYCTVCGNKIAEGSEITPWNIVADGATYVVANGTYESDDDIILTAGAEMPTPQIYDRYIYGDYIYMYNYELEGQALWDRKTDVEGWGVGINGWDLSKTQYGEILSSINGKPIVSTACTFYMCENLIKAPLIPDTVVSMNKTFSFCTSMTGFNNGFTMPSGVTNLNQTFRYCESLTNLPATIVIPENVKDMQSTFYECTNLTGTITINANPTTYAYCFLDTEQTITIAGSCSATTKANLAATSKNGNVAY